MLMLILIAVGCIIYYLSYKSPKTDLILYGLSGIFFLLAAAAGFGGYGDIQVGQTVNTTVTDVAGDKIIISQTTPIYTESTILNKGVPLVALLLGLYILIVLGIEPNQNEQRREKQSRSNTE